MKYFGNYTKEIVVERNGSVVFHYAGNPTEEEFLNILQEEQLNYPLTAFKVFEFGIEKTQKYIN